MMLSDNIYRYYSSPFCALNQTAGTVLIPGFDTLSPIRGQAVPMAMEKHVRFPGPRYGNRDWERIWILRNPSLGVTRRREDQRKPTR
jgi:hypothetical protein